VKIFAGSDHAGFVLKERLRKIAAELGHEVVDLGTHSAESVDYPDFGRAVAEAVVAAGPDARGVCACGTGIGISIAANKVHGARAAVVHDVTSAELTRRHNNSNIVCFGERLIGPLVAEEALKVFLTTAFEGGRHARRVEKLDSY
jgi:ribose 5-phosphate isomerase B